MIALKPAADNSVPVATKLSSPACTVASTAAKELADARAAAVAADTVTILFLVSLLTTISSSNYIDCLIFLIIKAATIIKANAGIMCTILPLLCNSVELISCAFTHSFSTSSVHVKKFILNYFKFLFLFRRFNEEWHFFIFY